MMEHAIAEPKQWRSLRCWIGRREILPAVMAAIGSLLMLGPKSPGEHIASSMF
ncbi:hypothetical protein [Streptomyces sp. NPDC050564]|uniref:hypothetical protein n=1 Tax=Streptomyces sp. NPDC050564 TaxID=3365631 RepID=UPI00379B0C7A